jgi:hypothetical protein
MQLDSNLPQVAKKWLWAAAEPTIPIGVPTAASARIYGNTHNAREPLNVIKTP